MSATSWYAARCESTSAPFSGCWRMNSHSSFVERLGLAQDRVRHAHLAEVVQQAGEVQRLRLFLRELERRRHVAAVHGHRRGVLRRVLVLAVQQHDHGGSQADVHLEVLVAQLRLARHVLLLAHEQLEHVLGGEQRDEEERDGDDARRGVQRSDRQTQDEKDRERPQERRHLFPPEGTELALVLHAHPQAQESEVGRLEDDGGAAAASSRPTVIWSSCTPSGRMSASNTSDEMEHGDDEVRGVVDDDRARALAPRPPEPHDDRHADGRQAAGEHDRQQDWAGCPRSE